MEAGYWPLYRFNPEAYEKGENPLTIDHVIPGPDNSGTNGSNEETTSHKFSNSEPLDYIAQYIKEEDRYIDLNMISPERADLLQPKLQQDCNRENEALGRI